MPVCKGSGLIDRAYLGQTEVDRMYLGMTLVYEKAGPVEPPPSGDAPVNVAMPEIDVIEGTP